MSFVVFFLAGLFFYIENNSNDEVFVEILDLGIKIDGNFYDFSKIRSYTLLYQDENAILMRMQLLQKGIKISDHDAQIFPPNML